MARARAETQLERLIDELHGSRLRVWSIVVSFFGDAITPRGGVLWLRTFRRLAERLRIESGTVGAAMSRLTADGWLVRDKRGRHTFYRLHPSGHEVFERATERIYGLRRPRAWNGRWTVLILPSGAPAPPGFAPVDARTWLRPDTKAPDPLPPGAVVFSASAGDAPQLQDLAAEAWRLAPRAKAYRSWMVRFSPLLSALQAGETLTPLSAMCARLLLIHDFRRVVLKDPDLPAALRGPAWPGEQARAHAGQLYRALLPASEAWLNASDTTPNGPLPSPKARFYRRFGGLRLVTK